MGDTNPESAHSRSISPKSAVGDSSSRPDPAESTEKLPKTEGTSADLVNKYDSILPQKLDSTSVSTESSGNTSFLPKFRIPKKSPSFSNLEASTSSRSDSVPQPKKENSTPPNSSREIEPWLVTPPQQPSISVPAPKEEKSAVKRKATSTVFEDMENPPPKSFISTEDEPDTAVLPPHHSAQTEIRVAAGSDNAVFSLPASENVNEAQKLNDDYDNAVYPLPYWYEEITTSQPKRELPQSPTLFGVTSWLNSIPQQRDDPVPSKSIPSSSTTAPLPFSQLGKCPSSNNVLRAKSPVEHQMSRFSSAPASPEHHETGNVSVPKTIPLQYNGSIERVSGLANRSSPPPADPQVNGRNSMNTGIVPGSPVSSDEGLLSSSEDELPGKSPLLRNEPSSSSPPDRPRINETWRFGAAALPSPGPAYTAQVPQLHPGPPSLLSLQTPHVQHMHPYQNQMDVSMPRIPSLGPLAHGFSNLQGMANYGGIFGGAMPNIHAMPTYPSLNFLYQHQTGLECLEICCAFCFGKHYSDNCQMYNSTEARLQRLSVVPRCIICLNQHHLGTRGRCPKQFKKTPICSHCQDSISDPFHNASLCPSGVHSRILYRNAMMFLSNRKVCDNTPVEWRRRQTEKELHHIRSTNWDPQIVAEYNMMCEKLMRAIDYDGMPYPAC